MIRNLLIATLIATIAAVFSSFQPFGISPDYAEYERFFDTIIKQGCGASVYFRFEEGYNGLTCLLSKFVYSPNLIYSFQVFLSVFNKILVMIIISKGNFIIFLTATILYFCKFFTIHELTQIRISLCISIIFISSLLIDIIFQKRKDNIKKNLNKLYFALVICIAVALLTHIASLFIFLLMWLAITAKTKKYSFYSFIAVLVVTTLSSQLITTFAVNFIPSAQTYGNGFGEEITIFSFSKLMDFSVIICVLFGFCTVNFEKVIPRLSFNMVCYALAAFYGFSSYPGFAYRMYESMQTFLVILICSLETRRRVKEFSHWIIYYSVSNILYVMNSGFFSPK